MTEKPDGPLSTVDDEQMVLDMLIGRSQGRIDNQLHDSDALDAKALGVLAIDAAAIALLVAVHGELPDFWWAPTVGLGAAGIVLLAVIWPRRFDVGPDPGRFYQAFGSSPAIVASRQMLSELLAAIDTNDAVLPAKGRLFKLGFSALVLSLLGCLPVALI